MSDLLFVIGGKDDLSSIIVDFLSLFARSEEYRKGWDEVVLLNRMPKPRIDELGTKAIQSICNINQTQMRTLQSCLKTELGSSNFATEQLISKLIDSKFVEPTTGTFKFSNERIPWAYKSLFNHLSYGCVHLILIKKKTLKGFDVAINLDHGKGHSWVSCNFIARFINKDQKYSEVSHACSIGNARCCKDNAAIIKNTFGELLHKFICCIYNIVMV